MSQLYRIKTAERHSAKYFAGVKFLIDRPKGYVKKWPLPDGREKVFVYPCDYGYFPGLTGEDGEGLDAFVGDDPKGHLEAFQKLKPSPDGPVLDETKFLIGVTDREREIIYQLYGEEIWARRVFHDVKELLSVVAKFRPSKKARYKTAELDVARNSDWEQISVRDSISKALRDHDSKTLDAGTENTMAPLLREGMAQ